MPVEATMAWQQWRSDERKMAKYHTMAMPVHMKMAEYEARQGEDSVMGMPRICSDLSTAMPLSIRMGSRVLPKLEWKSGGGLRRLRPARRPPRGRAGQALFVAKEYVLEPSGSPM